jgi:hypothetical protein
MKKVFLFFFFLHMGIFSYSQFHSIELKTYCFGNYEHNLIQKLTPDSRIELEKILKKNNIDTISFYRIKYDEVYSKYTTKDYLSNNTYTYINWYNFGGISKLNEFKKINGFKNEKPNKIIILYSTNNKDIEDLSVYILN